MVTLQSPALRYLQYHSWIHSQNWLHFFPKHACFVVQVKEYAEKAEVSAIPAGAAAKPASAAATSTDGGKKEAAPPKKPAQKSSKPAGKANDSAKPAPGPSSSGVST